MVQQGMMLAMTLFTSMCYRLYIRYSHLHPHTHTHTKKTHTHTQTHTNILSCFQPPTHHVHMHTLTNSTNVNSPIQGPKYTHPSTPTHLSTYPCTITHRPKINLPSRNLHAPLHALQYPCTIHPMHSFNCGLANCACHQNNHFTDTRVQKGCMSKNDTISQLHPPGH